jgi:hypothetical protein
MATHRLFSFYCGLLLLLAATFLTAGALPAKAGYMSAEKYPAPLSGTQTQEPRIYTNGGVFRCSSSAYTGTLPYESTTVTLKPTFSECSLAGLPVSVNPEGCSYEFVIGWIAGGGGVEVIWSSPMHIKCPKDQSIKISSSWPGFSCAMELKPQGALDPTYMRNIRGQDYWVSTYPSYPYLDHVTPGDVRVELDISNLSYTVTQDGAYCPFPGTGTFGYGDYESAHTLKATNALGHLRIN